ncbi:hypothetical protein GCM10023347_44630 [Streptomyces chumphonensis]|uniref:Uncharacterized protein n=1 Tax=Streptomyces chumphonensis TaxID=1214925 RepID=A0A927ICN5_9ACTN|nr:hypothetical protein [Streptomyces chumphonensis]MBD3932070.1 hypothetical protein [Streptomyces chumphonensis]
MLQQTMNGIPAGAHTVLAAPGGVVTTAETYGKAILAITVILALVTAFFSESQRKWVVVGSIVLIGGFTFMIVGAPEETLGDIGGFIKTNVWDPMLGTGEAV